MKDSGVSLRAALFRRTLGQRSSGGSIRHRLFYWPRAIPDGRCLRQAPVQLLLKGRAYESAGNLLNSIFDRRCTPLGLNERPHGLGWRFDCWQDAPLSDRELSKTAHFACQLSLMSTRICSGCTRFGSLQKRGAPRAKHNQRLDGPAAIAKVSVNIKIDVQRVGLNLRKSGLSAAYWAPVCWLEHGAAHPDTHAVSPAPMLLRCSWGTRSAKRRSTLS